MLDDIDLRFPFWANTMVTIKMSIKLNFSSNSMNLTAFEVLNSVSLDLNWLLASATATAVQFGALPPNLSLLLATLGGLD